MTCLNEYNVELEYFTAQARAEPIRIFLHDHGIVFKDTRNTFKQWKEMKQDENKFNKTRYPFGLMPILRLVPKNGGEMTTISGSLVILSHIEQRVGITSDDRSGMLIDYCNTVSGITWGCLRSADWDIGEKYADLCHVTKEFLDYTESFLDGSTDLLWQNGHLTAAGAFTLHVLDTFKRLVRDSVTYPSILERFHALVKDHSKAMAYLTSEAHTNERINYSPHSTAERVASAKRI